MLAIEIGKLEKKVKKEWRILIVSFARKERGEGGLRKFLWGCWTIFLNWNKKPAPRAYYNTIDFCKGGVLVVYVCEACGYRYDPALGDPDNGIAPGTKFEDIPEDWVCPLCGLGKDVFLE